MRKPELRPTPPGCGNAPLMTQVTAPLCNPAHFFLHHCPILQSYSLFCNPAHFFLQHCPTLQPPSLLLAALPYSATSLTSSCATAECCYAAVLIADQVAQTLGQACILYACCTGLLQCLQLTELYTTSKCCGVLEPLISGHACLYEISQRADVASTAG